MTEEYIERYLAIPREQEIGLYRTSVCVKGHRRDGKFRELGSKTCVDEEWLVSRVAERAEKDWVQR